MKRIGTRIIGGLVLFLLLLLGSIAASGASAEYTADQYAEYKANGTYPSESGKVFGGWYSDDTFTTVYTGADGETPTAKFVDEEVLKVKYQVSSTDGASESVKVRIVTSVDSLQYNRVGFIITTAGGLNRTFEIQNVYQRLTGYDGLTEFTYEPSVFSSESTHFAACIFSISKAQFDTVLHITPFWRTLDGTMVTGAARDISISTTPGFRKPWNAEISKAENSGYISLPFKEGSYYLTEDISGINMRADVTSGQTVTLDLNGFTASGPGEGGIIYRTRNSSTLNITDTSSSKAGAILCTGASSSTVGRVIYMWPGNSMSTVNLYGGTLGGTEDATGANGVVSAWHGNFNVYGGTINPIAGATEGNSNALSLGYSNTPGKVLVSGGTVNGQVVLNSNSSGLYLKDAAKVGIDDGSGKPYGISTAASATTGCFISCANVSANAEVILKDAVNLTISGTGDERAFEVLDGHNKVADNSGNDGIGTLHSEAAMCICGKVDGHFDHTAYCMKPSELWQPWNEEISKATLSGTVYLPWLTGSYYLTEDMELAAQTQTFLNRTVTLDLAGHTVTSTGVSRALQLTSGGNGTFNLTDSQSGGELVIAGASEDNSTHFGRAVWIRSTGKFNQFGGTIRSTEAVPANDSLIRFEAGYYRLIGGTVQGRIPVDGRVTENASPIEVRTGKILHTTIRAGFGKADMTPGVITGNVHVELGGYDDTATRKAVGALEPLSILALAITDESNETYIIVITDLSWGSIEEAELLRTYVSNTYGIPGDHLVLGGTHNHSTASDSSGSGVNAQYFAAWRIKIHEAIDDAMADRKPASIEVGRTETENLVFSRRYVRSDGNYVGGGPNTYNVQSSAPIVAHETEADEEIQMVRFVRSGAKDILIAQWQSHACNIDATRSPDPDDWVLNESYLHYYASAEWPGIMRSAVEEALDVNCIYMQGAAGNMACNSKIDGEFAIADITDYVAIGERLASYVIAANQNSNTFREAARGSLQTDQHRLDVSTSGGAAVQNDEDKPELNTMSIGGLSLVTLPVELFDTSAKWLKDNTPSEMTLIMGYSCGVGGYQAPDWAYPHGCYEVVHGSYARGTAENMMTYYLDTLNRFYGTDTFTPAANQLAVDQAGYVTASSLSGTYVTTEGGMVFVNALDSHIEIGGITNPLNNSGEYYRLDASRKSDYSEGVNSMAHCTSGVTLRFCTNASSIVLRATMRNSNTDSRNMTARGEYGFDVYTGSGTKRTYCGANMQMMFDKASLNETITLPGGYTEVLIDLPMYAGVESISIGFPAAAKVAAPTGRAHDPICFYGSSITQGCSASRPGNAYTNMVTRMLNTDCFNLGFSSSAKGEQILAEYIAGLTMSAFVMDYDYNSSISELSANHYNFYKTIRNSQPDLPIILLSRPFYGDTLDSAMNQRIAIIRNTYNQARAEGDEHIYILNGSEYFPEGMRELFMIDTTHPNDLGQYYIGLALYDVLNGILNGTETTFYETALADFSFVPSADDSALAAVGYSAVSALTGSYVSTEGSTVFVNALDDHIEIGGITDPKNNRGEYYRLDASRKSDYSEGVRNMANLTSGVTLRFCTDADQIILRVTMRNISADLKNMTARGEYGFDVYTGSGTKRSYCGANMQMMFDKTSLNETITLPGGYTEVLIDLPMYAGVESISIGFPDTAKIGGPTSRAHDPICFYGSSITQGCSASRPGNAYTNMVTRMLNTDCINLGFSSSARGEQVLAEYIAGLTMSAFVMDYDYNSTLSELTANHYDFYKTVRDANPDLPIILVSRPCYLETPSAEMLQRIAVIRDTYNRARADGDTNIYFVNGSEFFPAGLRELFSIDTTHPNDLGMYYMGLSIYEVLDQILNH